MYALYIGVAPSTSSRARSTATANATIIERLPIDYRDMLATPIHV